MFFYWRKKRKRKEKREGEIGDREGFRITRRLPILGVKDMDPPLCRMKCTVFLQIVIASNNMD